MRCPQCTERNSVAARKCEFCGEKFKRKPVPLAMKLGISGVAIAVTASIAASLVLPKLVDPEQNLGRVAKRMAAGPSSVDDAQKIKKEFATAVKSYLKDNGTAKTPELTAGLEKLLPSSAYEVHVAELPRGLRVVEIDTVLQASDFLVMKTSSGLKVFDLPGFEVFDDARILNDSAGPVLALIGHSGGPPPHKPHVRTYALLPDYVNDETEKLVPAMTGDGQARFASNDKDIQVELVKAQGKGTKSSHDDISYGMLHWKDAKYTADFTTQTAKYVAKHFNDTLATAHAAPVAAPPVTPAPVTSIASSDKPSLDIKANSTVKEVVSVAVPSLKKALSKGSDQNAKIVVRGLTDKQPVSANELIGKMPPAAPASSGAALAAVPVAPPVAPAVVRTVTAPIPGNGNNAAAAPKPQHTAPTTSNSSKTTSSKTASAGTSSSHSYATVTCNGATVRSAPGRGAKAIDGMSHGQQVEVIGHEGDWYKIRYMGGREGYVFSQLVSTGGSVPAATVASAPAADSSSSSHKSSRHHHHRDSVLVADATQHVSRNEERHSRTESSSNGSSEHHSSKHKSRKHSQASQPVVEAPTLVP